MSDIKVKRCPRCNGNLFLERDKYGYFVACIQCGADYPVKLFSRDDMPERAKLAEPAGAGAR